MLREYQPRQSNGLSAPHLDLTPCGQSFRHCEIPTAMSDTNDEQAQTSGAQSLSAAADDRQPTPSTLSASVQARKAQSSIGACDACRLRKVIYIRPHF